MQLSFEELKTLYRSLYVSVNDLVCDNKGVSNEDWVKSEDAWERLDLLRKLIVELGKYRTIII